MEKYGKIMKFCFSVLSGNPYCRRRVVFLLSIVGFSGMPDIVVLSEEILDIALWVKNPR